MLDTLFEDRQVRREIDDLVPDNPAVLIIIDSEENPDARDLDRLADWVYGGGVLVFAPAPTDPELDAIELLGFEFRAFQQTVSDDSTSTSDRDSAAGDEEEEGATDEDGSENVRHVAAQMPGLEGSFEWLASCRLDVDRLVDSFEVVTGKDGTVHVAAIFAGEGAVIPCSGSENFSNHSLLEPRTAEPAIRIVELADELFIERNGYEPEIVISEVLNASRVGDTWAILLGPALRAGTLQIILAGVLIAWFGFQRFGPVRQTTDVRRASMADSARALGNLQYRAHDGAHVVSRYADYIQTRLRQRAGYQQGLDDREAIARRTGIPADDIRRELDLVGKVAKSPHVSAPTAARAIRTLADLYNRLSAQGKP